MAEICAGPKAVEIYLESWQRRMVKDVLGVDCESWSIPVKIKDWVKYRSPVPAASIMGQRMYFTDWQQNFIKNATGCACDFTELLKNSNLVRYRVPPEKITDKHLKEATAIGPKTLLVQK